MLLTVQTLPTSKTVMQKVNYTDILSFFPLTSHSIKTDPQFGFLVSEEREIFFALLD